MPHCLARSLSGIMAVLLAAVELLPAQKQERVESMGATIRSVTRLVQVQVIAEDRKGTPVTDLAKSDFELFDDGKLQRISSFSLLSGIARTAVQPTLASRLLSNRLVPTAAAETVSCAVIILDLLNTPLSDRMSARAQVLQLLRQIGPEQKVELLVLERGLRVVHDLTGDFDALLRRIQVLGRAMDGVMDSGIFDASRGMADLGLLPSIQSSTAGGRSPVNPTLQVFELERRILSTLEAFGLVADRLARVPGRKVLIWVSAGFPLTIDSRAVPGANQVRTFSQEIDAAVRKLNAADIGVFPIDARGLSTNPNAYITIESLKEIAKRTGGRAWYNRNDIAAGMRTALEEPYAGYMLGYLLPDDQATGGVHRLRIRVNRAGIRLRYRPTYDEEDGGPADPESELQRALQSPLNWLSIPLAVAASRGTEAIELLITIDLGSVSLSMQDGRWSGALDLITQCVDVQGRQAIPPTLDRMTLNLAPETREQALREGLATSKTIGLTGHCSQLRLVVYDRLSGKAGSLHVPLSTIAAPGSSPSERHAAQPKP